MLKNARLEANFSQEEMGEVIGYNGKVVAAIENGNRTIGLKILIKWADAVGKELKIELIEKSWTK